MKKIQTMIYVAGMLMAAGLASCEMKDELKGNTEIVYSEVGYLDLGVAVGQGSSRAEDSSVSANDFPVEIVGTDVEYTKIFESYEKMLEESPIVLPVGNYTVTAHTNGILEAVMDNPYYGGQTPLTIKKDVTETAEVVCKMENTKIQMVYDTEFLNTFDTWDITVTDGSQHILTYTEADKNPKAKYWLIQEGISAIKVQIEAITKDSVKVSETRLISKPEDADSEFWGGSDDLKITMTPGDPDANTGVGGIEVKVEITFTERDETVEIPVEGDDEVTEPSEPEKPGDEEDTEDSEEEGPSVIIPQSTYILPDDASKNANVTIKAEAGIKSVMVVIKADNNSFEDALGLLEGVNFSTGVELVGNNSLEEILSYIAPGLKVPAAGDTEYIFPVGAFFEALSSLDATETSGHEFIITVKDNKENEKGSSLKVKVVK